MAEELKSLPVVLVQKDRKPYLPTFHSPRGVGLLVLGTVQVVLGLTCFSAGIVDMVRGCSYYARFAAGYWTGFIILEAGCFSIVASRTKSTAMVATTLFFSCLAVLLSVCAIVLGSLSIRDVSSDPDYCRDRDNESEVSLGMNGLLIACGAVELFIGIATSALCYSIFQLQKVFPAKFLGLPPSYQPVTYFTALGEPVHLFQYLPDNPSAVLPPQIRTLSHSSDDLTQSKIEI